MCHDACRAFSDVRDKLDYSIVKMHLYTMDGLLKYSTECAPNGYYFIPVYDKGSFYLQIDGPAGWTFEPTRVPFTVGDGDAGGGSCAEDINFKFTGFTLSGRVTAAASSNCYTTSNAGPAGVTLTLTGGDGRSTTTQSQVGGSFVFANVYPGSYSVTASHAVWSIAAPITQSVTLTWGNAEVKDPFVVSGYNVRGSVSASGEPVAGVDVFLYQNKGVQTTLKLTCPQPTSSTAKPGMHDERRYASH